MIVVAGGGLSGLSTAYFLRKKGFQVVVLEQSPFPGGCIQSREESGFLLEAGANSLLYSDYLAKLVKELGLGDQLIEASPTNKNRYIFKNGKYKKLPSGPLSLFFGDFFSWSSKWNVLKEFTRTPGLSDKKDLRSFFIEHFGVEVADYAMTPFVSGIYAGDPAELLVVETFPSLVRFEEQSGSILKGMIRNAGKRRKLVTFKKGMSALPISMAQEVDVRYNSVVSNVEKKGGQVEVTFSVKGAKQTITATAVILALPAYGISSVLKSSYSLLSETFRQVDYCPMTLVYSAYKESDLPEGLYGFGGLNPKKEGRFSAGSIWTSSVFPDRSPRGHFLFTTFVGGTLYKDHAILPDEEIFKRVSKELRDTLKVKGAPVFQEIYRWEKALPQYNFRIPAVRSAASALEKENIFICSNIFDGVSIEDCIKKGEVLAGKIMHT